MWTYPTDKASRVVPVPPEPFASRCMHPQRFVIVWTIVGGDSGIRDTRYSAVRRRPRKSRRRFRPRGPGRPLRKYGAGAPVTAVTLRPVSSLIPVVGHRPGPSDRPVVRCAERGRLPRLRLIKKHRQAPASSLRVAPDLRSCNICLGTHQKLRGAFTCVPAHLRTCAPATKSKPTYYSDDSKFCEFFPRGSTTAEANLINKYFGEFTADAH